MGRGVSRWWRAYDDALNDPKVQGLEPDLFKAWFNVLCIASKYDETLHGTLPGTFHETADVAFHLRISVSDARFILEKLRARGLLDEAKNGAPIPHNWNGRQYKSDTSTDRVKRFRKRFGNVSVTPPDTEQRQSTETDTDIKKVPAADAALELLEVVGEDQRARLFRVGKTILASFGVAEKRTGSLIGQWLKARDDPPGIVAVLEYARDHNIAEPVAYVSAIIHGKSKNGGGGNETDRRPGESLGDLGRRLARKARELERTKGHQRKDDAF
jgi:hypothetical protein